MTELIETEKTYVAELNSILNVSMLHFIRKKVLIYFLISHFPLKYSASKHCNLSPIIRDVSDGIHCITSGFF